MVQGILLVDVGNFSTFESALEMFSVPDNMNSELNTNESIVTVVITGVLAWKKRTENQMSLRKTLMTNDNVVLTTVMVENSHGWSLSENEFNSLLGRFKGVRFL
jgi:hypothetical protein